MGKLSPRQIEQIEAYAETGKCSGWIAKCLGVTVNVARPGPWGNPFAIGEDGTRAECVRLYALLMGGHVCLTTNAAPMWQKRAREYAEKHISELRGKNLACWCHGSPCHADVLLEIANA